MIVRMSKVEIVGPKELLVSVLSQVQELGIFQVETDVSGFVEKGEKVLLRPLALDEKTLTNRLFYEELRLRIDELFSYLPKTAIRKSYLDPSTVLDSIAETIKGHIAHCRELHEQREPMLREREELSRYTLFLDTLESLLERVDSRTNLDFIGVTIKDPAAVEHLIAALSHMTGRKVEIVTAIAFDGTLIGLITTVKGLGEKVKKCLRDERVPELSFPPSFDSLAFPEKLRYMKQRLSEISGSIAAIDAELETFAGRWMAIYHKVREWLDEQISLLKTTAFIHETGMCFFIHGWIPAADVPGLAVRLNGKYGGKVVVEEKKILEQELEMVPVALKNPAYFQPFELFARLLPLPRYTSYDPTPFIGVFFPIFFGMMLGDAGHGAFLFLVSLVVMRVFRNRRNVSDAAKILSVSSAYAVVFGVFYGEFFGEFGAELFGFRPMLTERRTAIMPMLFFALSVGIMHVTFGLVLGVASAFRKKTKREALFKLLNIFIILCLVILFISLFIPLPQTLIKPVVITIPFTIVLLAIFGGLMGPLELVKNIGNIVSYARIMAIGLTSVFLATVANHLAGMTGNIVTGTIVAAMLHAFNIVIGVFAPTIHALRLHYVEFFSKFLEYGGRKFEPLKK